MLDSVIFLDIDGVLCINGKFQESSFSYLEKVVKKSNSKVVLSSNWRNDSYHKKIIELELKKYNIEIYDVTPNFNDKRPLEILFWCFINTPRKYIIIDDRNLYREFIHLKISGRNTFNSVYSKIYNINNLLMQDVSLITKHMLRTDVKTGLNEIHNIYIEKILKFQ